MLVYLMYSITHFHPSSYVANKHVTSLSFSLFFSMHILLHAEIYADSTFYFFSIFCSHLVVAQAYKVDVEVLPASRGCTAILRCVIPTFVKELVRVVSWVQEPAFFVYPSLQGGK